MSNETKYFKKKDVMKVLELFSKKYPYVVSPKEQIDGLSTFSIDGNTSDGYHTFNELYHHRAVLFSVICNTFPYSMIAWKSKKHHDGTMFDGMFIVGIDTPDGQATYHYDISPYWHMFNVKELEMAPEWDGHTPEEAINRISSLTRYMDNFHFRNKEHKED